MEKEDKIKMETQILRLSKVAKELNIGKDSLVECLKQHGHDVDPSPNTKITLEQYDILMREFTTEVKIPTEAKTMYSKEKDKPQTNANTKEKSQMHIDSFKAKSDDEILRFLFNYWKLNGAPNSDGSFSVVASYQKAGKDKNGFDCGYFVNIRSLNGDILYYPFHLGKISIYTPHNDSYEKEELLQIHVKLNKEKYRQDNPFSLQIADRVVGKIKNSFVDRLEKEKLIRTIFDETGATKRDAKNTANALLSIMGDLYSEGDERFIFELLQNADDQPQDDRQFVSVKLKALSEHLIFTHSGKPFSKEDVESISSIGDSTKKNDSQKTGYKGIGFKSVFSGADTVFIDSGSFSFAFDKYSPVYKGETNMDEIPWQLKPIWEERYRLPEEVALDCDYLSCPVGIALQIGAEKLDTYKAKIHELFAEPRFMLFLRHIGDIEYCGIEDNADIGIHKSVMGDEFVTISSNDSVSMWNVKDFDFDIPPKIHELMQNDKLAPNKLKNAQRSRMSFATLIHDSSIQPIDDSALFCYLPTKVCEFGFPFLVNADFLTTASRESIHNKNIWNQFLFGQIGKLIVQWAIHLSNYKGYLNFLPKKLLSDSNPLSEYFNVAYKSALESEAFILNHKGELSKKSEIIIDKTGLSRIVGPDLFCWLLKTDKCLPSEVIDCDILKSDLFDIETKEFEENIIDVITHNSDFNEWFVASNNEQKEQLFTWIRQENDSQEKNEKLVSFVSSLPLFQFGDEFKAFDELDDYIITTDKNIVIKSILQKLGFRCSDNVFDDRHPLFEFVKPQDKKLLFERIKKLDFSQLDLTERRELFHVIESDYFEGIGEAKIKELALFKNMNDEFMPLCEMVAYEEDVPDWLKSYVLNKVESFDELSKYLIAEDKYFEEVVWKHKKEFPGTAYELYNMYKWTDEKYTRQLINELKETDAFRGLISLVEDSSKDTQKYYLQSIAKIELLPNAKYGKDSYEYRVLQIALAVYDAPTAFSSKVFYDGRCIKDFSVKDKVVCEYTQSGETKEVCFSLTKLLPNYQDLTSSIEQVKLLFEGNGEDIEKFFNLKSKSKHEVYKELNEYLFYEYKYRTNKYSRSYGTYSTTVTEFRWIKTPSMEQYLFVSMYGIKQLKEDLRLNENDCAELIDLLYMNGKVQISTVSFVDFFYENHIKNKCFDNDFIFESERLYKTIESWATDESKKQYLIQNGVKSPSSPSVRFRQLFLEDKDIDFIDEITDEDLTTGLEFIATADGYSRPFEGDNQEKTLKYLLKEKKCKGLIDKWNLDKMVEVAHEWNSLEYNKWKEGHSMQILLYPRKLPHQLFYNNTMVLKYESGYKYYDSSNQRLFISEDNVQKTLLGIIDDQKIPFSSEDYVFLFAVISKDDFDRIDKENELLRDENALLKNELEQLKKRLGINDEHPSNIIGDANSSTTITIQAGQPSSSDKDSQIAAQLEAQKRLMQELPDWTFPENYGESDEDGKPYNFSTVEVKDEEGSAVPIVLKSYKNQDKSFKINPEEWEYISKKGARLWIFDIEGLKEYKVQDLVRNQTKIALTFSTENLDIEERIDAFSEALHYFNEIHFDFDSFNISKKAEKVADMLNKNKRRYQNTDNTEAEI